VGINTAIYTQSGSAAGIGFAVPVDTATRVAEQLIAGGKVTHPYIGLIGSTINPLVATEKKLSVQEGALVESLVPGAGAQKGGVKVGDVVTQVDGVRIASMNDLIGEIRKHGPGDTVTLTLLRGAQTTQVKVVVADRPADVSTSVPPTSSPTTK
jgi:S1-C subfamily serine protease